MNLFADSYRNQSVLVTGHTGFKGSWLALWLEKLGAKVTGISLPPETTPNHISQLTLKLENVPLDIREFTQINATIQRVKPRFVFHLAAQPLVLRSYRDPIETWTTNVTGTVNILEACRQCPSVKSIVVVTSDKCYENRDWVWSYRENDRLGGHDPYSASKAATEIVVESYRRSFFSTETSAAIASVRAGNVIGGGDWSEDRLFPDIVRAYTEKRALVIRSPNSIRPWQHVLDALSGYLLIGQKLLQSKHEFDGAWNFGPDDSNAVPVIELLKLFEQEWPGLRWESNASPKLHEANVLRLDTAKSRNLLKWKPVWNLQTAVSSTVSWYRRFHEERKVITNDQIERFIVDATRENSVWVTN